MLLQIFAGIIVLINIYYALEYKNFHSILGWTLALFLYVVSQIS